MPPRCRRDVPGKGRRAGRRAGRARLGADLPVHRPDILRLDRLAHALAAAALRRLDHDRVADLLRHFDRLLGGGDARGLEDVIGHLKRAVARRRDRHAGARPLDARHAGGLCDDGGRDLVSEEEHRPIGRADESDPKRLERARQIGILGCVAPAGPHRVALVRLREPDDQVHVGVVVEVGPAGHFEEGVRRVDVLSVRLRRSGGTRWAGRQGGRADALIGAMGCRRGRGGRARACAWEGLEGWRHARTLRSSGVAIAKSLMRLSSPNMV